MVESAAWTESCPRSRAPRRLRRIAAAACALVSSALPLDTAAAQMPQTIAFDAMADQIVGAAPSALWARASSGLPVTFSSLTPAACTIAGNRLIALAAGTCTVRAAQPGDASNAPAPTIDRSVAIRTATTGPLFALPVNYAVGQSPDGLASGDFNGDGNVDLASVNWSEGTLSVLFGQGDGTFRAAGTYAAGYGPSSIVAADVNGDGRTDLAVANVLGKDVRVLLGHGDGTFEPGSVTNLGYALAGIAAGDLNGDGKVDLVVTNGTSDGVTGVAVVVLLGDGTGSFPVLTTLATGTNPVAAALRDVNGDGRPDLVVVESDSGTVSVRLATGGGDFAARTPYPVGPRPVDVAIGDVNGDGKLDLAVVDSLTDDVSVLLNRGDGTFGTAVAYPAGSAPGALAIADLDRDGKPDLVIMNEFDDDVVVLLGNGNGTFQAPQHYGVLGHPMALVAADFNGDGQPDLAVATTVGNAVSVLLHASAPGTPASITISSGSPQSAVINTVFATPLSVLVRDSLSRAVPSAIVTFTAPTPGASGTFGSARSAEVIADSSGRATAPPFTANGVIGSFAVIAASGTARATLALSNLSAAAVAPAFTSPPPPGGIYNAPYNYQVTASGSPPPTFSVVANALPPGLTLSAASGAISGTPAATGTFAGTLSASNGTLPNAAQAFAITIGGMAQSINFAPLANRSLGTAPFAVVATSSSGLPVGLTALAPSVCTLAGSTVTLLATGTCSIRATQAGSATYAAAASVDRSFVVGPPNRVPAVALVQPANGYTYVTPAIVPLLATANDPDGKVTKVEFYSGAILLGVATAAPYRYVWTNVPAGSYAIKAIAYDDGGAATPSAVVNIVVNATGSGVSFASAIAYPTPNHANVNAVAAGDFTGDHVLDLLMDSTWRGLMLPGAGNGTFLEEGSRSSWTAKAFQLGGLVVGDLNADGKLDFAASGGDGILSFLGQGDGTFVLGGLAPTTSAIRGLALADVTADGRLDVVAALSDGSIVLATGNGDGTLKAPIVLEKGVSPTEGVAIGDLNGDGRLDLVVTSPTDRSIHILLGAGGGTFRQATATAIGAYPAYANKVVLADFNGDGRLDVAVTDFFGPTVTILIGNGDGTFQPSVDYPVGPWPYEIAARDLNGDGKVDLVVNNQDTRGGVSVLLGNGNGTFRSPVTYPTGTLPYGLAVADFDADGRPDIAITDWNGMVNIHMNTTAAAVKAPLFTNGPPPDAVVGPYSFTYTASGIPAPNFSLTNASPELMSNMVLSQTGELAGRPPIGVHSGTVIADNGIATAAQPFALAIRGINQTIAMSKVESAWPPGSGIFYSDAVASSGLPVTVTSLTPSVCRADPATTVGIQFVTKGVCRVRADQVGDAYYARAPSAYLNVTSSIATPPVVITSPAHRAGYASGSSIKISATARPAAPGWGVNRVSFFADGALIGTATSAPYTVTWNNVPTGTYQLVARSTDRSYPYGLLTEAETDSAAVTIVVVATPDSPTVSLVAPPPGSELFAPSEVKLSATASDATQPIKHVEFYNGAALLGIVTTPPYQFVWSNVPPGSYTASAVAVSSTGIAAASSPATFSVEAGLPRPVAQYTFDETWDVTGLVRDSASGAHARRHGSVSRSTAPALGLKGETCRAATFAGGTIDNAGIPVSTAPDARTTVAFWMRWNGVDGAVPFAWATQGLLLAGGNFGFTTFNNDVYGTSAAGLANGWHYVVAEFTNGRMAANRLYIDDVEQPLTVRSGVAIDANAVTSTALHLGGRAVGMPQVYRGELDEFMVFDGALAPEHVAALKKRSHACGPMMVEILAPPSKHVYEAPSDIDLFAAAASSAGHWIRVDFYANGTLIGSADDRNGAAMRWRNPAAGTYAFTAVAHDELGGTVTSAAVPVTVSPPRSATAPVVSLIGPANGSAFWRPARIDLVASPTAPGAGIVMVQFLANGKPIGLVSAPPYHFVWTGMTTGSYSVTARVTDTTGATADSAAVGIQVGDPVTQAAPTIALTAPVANAQFAAGQTISLAASANAYGRGIGRIDFSSDGATLGSVPVTAGATSATARFSWTGAALGSHTVRATLVLVDGTSVASALIPIAVRDVAVRLVAPSPGQVFIAPGQVHLTASASEVGANITRVDFLGDGVLLGSRDAAPYELVWNGVAAGSHTIAARAVDSNGLTVATAPVSIAVLAAPDVTIDAGIDGTTANDDSISLGGALKAPSNSAASVNGQVVPVSPDGKFFVDNMPLTAGANTVTVTVNTPDGGSVSRTVTVNSNGVAPFRVLAEPQEGLAPLDVDLVITNRANVPLQRIEISTRPDGLPEITLNGPLDNPYRKTLRLPNPGLYTIQLKMFDSANVVIYTAKRRVLARDPRDLVFNAVQVYHGMVDRLRVGNTTGALNAFSGGARDKYQQVLTALQPSLPSIVDQLGTVQGVTVTAHLAELALVRNGTTGAQTFHVYVIRSEDGIWRLDGM